MKRHTHTKRAAVWRVSRDVHSNKAGSATLQPRYYEEVLNRGESYYRGEGGYLGQAEVRDLDVAVFIEQDVARLEVVVNDCASPILSLALRDDSTSGYMRRVAEVRYNRVTHLVLSASARGVHQSCHTYTLSSSPTTRGRNATSAMVPERC